MSEPIFDLSRAFLGLNAIIIVYTLDGILSLLLIGTQSYTITYFVELSVCSVTSFWQEMTIRYTWPSETEMQHRKVLLMSRRHTSTAHARRSFSC
jgi:hypothetical protein